MQSARKLTRVGDWPSRDQEAWLTAKAHGDIFKGSQGLACDWRPQTRITNEKHYGGWIGFLRQVLILDGDASPESRITRTIVKEYLAFLQANMAPYSAMSAIVGLTQM